MRHLRDRSIARNHPKFRQSVADHPCFHRSSRASVRPGSPETTASTAKLRRHGIDVEGPVEHEGGDRSLYVSDPEGNRVELWDYFTAGDGDGAGVGGLAGNAQPVGHNCSA